MKLFTALAATSMLLAGSAFATASTNAPAPTAAAPAKAAPAPTATKPAHEMDSCSKDAASKGLHGKSRKSFLKDCRAPKK
jgi:hypothetical protein